MPFFHDPYRPASARGGDDAPKAVSVAKTEDESEKVPNGTSKEVLAWVGDDKDRARAALAKEQADEQPRKGLVKDLNEVLAEEDDTEDESTSD